MDELQESWASTVEGFAPWWSFWTLTFDLKGRGFEVSEDEANNRFRRFIQILNVDLFGKHYVQMVGHCYFPYAKVWERKAWGLGHLHALVSGPTNYTLANSVWRLMGGIIVIKPVTEQVGAARYVSKYVTKGGDVELWRPRKMKEPSFKPLWYQDVMKNRLQTNTGNIL
jgi:hypothetical protein